MKTPLLSTAFALVAVVALTAGATAQSRDCYADYKAKQDSPLKLHYGVISLEKDCSRESAAGEIAERIAREGWTLLNVLSVFDADGLEQRKSSAGKYYLRF